MIGAQGVTAGATVAIAAWRIVESAESGATLDQLLGQGTIVGTGVAVFLWQERRRKAEAAAANKARRESDKSKDNRIRELERQVDHLVRQITRTPEEGTS